jgi:hypothetical protein
VKRAFILDALAVLDWTCRMLDVRGPVLDVGCHAGYHIAWLAKSLS